MFKKIAIAFVALLVLAGCKTGGRYGSGNAKIDEFQTVVGDRVFFALDSSTLTEESKATLSRQAAWLKDNSKFNLTVEGHCDERGTKEYNIALGDKRAQAVAEYLKSQGLDASRVETISYGKERPAEIGNTESAWSKNRRGVTSLR
jgi:peptidoglycan-associated lipoprotein